MRGKRLKDLGENSILKQLILPKFPSIQRAPFFMEDDCAVILPKQKGHVIVTTMDPCPTPVAFLIDRNKDYYHFGWFTVIINVSDLAAVGAEPIGLLVSTIMPEEMLVSNYIRFLDGLADASKRFCIPIIGGNIKDGKEFSATGTAFGSIDTKLIMQRKGARSGDLICVIGEMGLFWTAVISHLRKIRLPRKETDLLHSAMYKPIPKIQEGIHFAKGRLLSSCIDSSDGISSCLYTLAQCNKIDLEIDSDLFHPHPLIKQLAEKFHLDYKKLMLAWGGWELVGTIPPKNVKSAEKIIKTLGSQFTIVGKVVEGPGNVRIIHENEIGLLTDFGSYRFCNTSYFSHGINAYIDYLINAPILKKF